MPTNRRDFLKDISLLAAGGLIGEVSVPAGAQTAPASAPASAPATAPASAPPAPPPPPPLASPIVDQETVRAEFDLIVVGGGISGTCAAIAAARQGVRVALVHERSMLGGNSSSEVRLFPEGNHHFHPWIKEGGIHSEFLIEERVRNHQIYKEGLMNCHWDLVLYEWAIREKNLTLLLNTHMHRATMRDPAHIASITCIQLGTEKDYELSAPLFIDASGDGVLAFRARADFRWGKEAKSEYHEPLAPDQASDRIMGNTLFFRALNMGRPIPFKLPDWAASFPKESDLTDRHHGFIEGGYWWIEVGAPMHPIKDNNEIRHEALRQLLGVWDHLKNRGPHGVENYGIEFVGFWPYKRESRRILGDYVVTQQHVQNPRPLEDAVAYGCWGIDIHHPGGILNREQEPYPVPRRDANWDAYGSQVYGIPLRALYSRNVENLMMAGRPISCSYAAFASSRVLSTGAIVGQAAGTAAALAVRHKKPPRAIAKEHAKECQQILLRHDGHIPGVVNEDPADLARSAEVAASSQAPLAWPEPNGRVELKLPHAQIFPASLDRVDAVELLLDAKNDAELKVGLRRAAHVWDFRAADDIAQAVVQVPAGTDGPVKIDLNAKLWPNQLYYLHVSAAPGVFWKTFKEAEDRPTANPVGVTAADLPGKTLWRPYVDTQRLAMRVLPEQQPYGPGNVNRGTNRPDMWTNIWISDPAQPLPAWIELRWPQLQKFNTVQLSFDTDMDHRATLPLFRYPDCVKDYALDVATPMGWKEVLGVKDNYERRRVHRIDPAETDKLRVRVLATNGTPSARIYEIRVYSEA